jgi:glycogen(starch) synthase
MLGWEFPPAINGGLGVATYGLSEELARKVDLKLVIPTSLPQRGPWTAYGYASSPPPPPELSAYLQQSLEEASQDDFDLIHAHDWLTFAPALKLKEESGKPLVLHVHATEYDRAGPEAEGWIYELEKEAFEKADLILPVSKYTAEVIREAYQIVEDKIMIVHNGIAKIEPYRLEKAFPEPLIVYSGRLARQKGPDTLLEAAFQLLEQGQDLRFAFAGEGPMAYELMSEVARRDLGDRIFFMGFLNQDRLFDLLAMADLYVMPSRAEPFGLAALEAARFGLPCLVSQDAGVRELMPDMVPLVPEDAEGLAQAIQHMLSEDSFRRQLGNRLARVSERLDWEQVAQKVVMAYDRLKPA